MSLRLVSVTVAAMSLLGCQYVQQGISQVKNSISGKREKTAVRPDPNIIEATPTIDDTNFATVRLMVASIRSSRITLIGIENGEASCTSGTPKYKSETRDIRVPVSVTTIGICGEPGEGAAGTPSWKLVDVKGKLKPKEMFMLHDLPPDSISANAPVSGLATILLHKDYMPPDGTNFMLIAAENGKIDCASTNAKYKSTNNMLNVPPATTAIGICGTQSVSAKGKKNFIQIDTKGKLKPDKVFIIRRGKIIEQFDRKEDK
jgi:hypothetical protein